MVFVDNDRLADSHGNDSGATVERLFFSIVLENDIRAEVYVNKAGAAVERVFADLFAIGKIEFAENEFVAYAERSAAAERAFADRNDSFESFVFFNGNVFKEVQPLNALLPTVTFSPST